MDDNGLIRCEISIPSIQVHSERKNFYNPQACQDRFDGEEGGSFSRSKLVQAQAAINDARSAIGDDPSWMGCSVGLLVSTNFCQTPVMQKHDVQ